MFEPIKSLGQNFLVDKSVARDMVNALDVRLKGDVIEIGPGNGVVTDFLVDKFKDSKQDIYPVEIDERFFKKLENVYSGEEKIHLVHQDILSWLPGYNPSGEFQIIGSLPYYITSPIIHSIIRMKKLPRICVFLIQKEVAEKIKSKVPDSSYMSCFVQTFFDVLYLGKVPSSRFKPEPEVDGGILKLVRKDGEFNQEFKEKYEGFLHKAFSNPRKMLNKMFSKEELKKGDIDPTLRAQNLSADEWVNFFKKISL